MKIDMTDTFKNWYQKILIWVIKKWVLLKNNISYFLNKYVKNKNWTKKVILEIDKLNMDIVVQSETKKNGGGGGEMLGN